MANIDFIISEKKRIEDCPECGCQSLFDINSITIGVDADAKGNIKEENWTYSNQDVKCSNCDYRKIINSCVGLKYNIKWFLRGDYKNSGLDALIKYSLDYMSQFSKEEIMNFPAFGVEIINKDEFNDKSINIWPQV